MKKNHLVLGTALLLLLLAAGSCKNAGNEPTAPTPPTPPVLIFSSPGTQDQCSQTADSIVNTVNEYTFQLATLAPFPPTVNGNVYTWTLPLTGLTITVTATRQAGDSFAWEVRFNGVQDTVTYSNKLMISGTTTAADGKNGSMTVFSETDSTEAGVFTWSTSTANVISASFVQNDENGDEAFKIELISHPSGAGEVTAYVWSGGWIQVSHATWTTSEGQASCS